MGEGGSEGHCSRRVAPEEANASSTETRSFRDHRETRRGDRKRPGRAAKVGSVVPMSGRRQGRTPTTKRRSEVAGGFDRYSSTGSSPTLCQSPCPIIVELEGATKCGEAGKGGFERGGSGPESERSEVRRRRSAGSWTRRPLRRRFPSTGERSYLGRGILIETGLDKPWAREGGGGSEGEEEQEEEDEGAAVDTLKAEDEGGAARFRRTCHKEPGKEMPGDVGGATSRRRRWRSCC